MYIMYSIEDKSLKRGAIVVVIIAALWFGVYFHHSLKDKLILGDLDPASCDVEAVILDIRGEDITLAPPDYDADEAERYKDRIEKRKLAEGVRCFSVDVETMVDVNGERESTENYEKLSLKEVKEALHSTLPSAYIWYDKEEAVTAIMLHGETITEE